MSPGLLRRCSLAAALFLVCVLGVLLPSRLRADWVEEWQGELVARYAHDGTAGVADTGDADDETADFAGADRTPESPGWEPLLHLRGVLNDVLWHLGEEWNTDMLAHDLRSALRAVVRRPAFTAIVVVTLALGIGANAVIFSAVDAVVLDPFDFREADRVVGVGTEYPRLGRELGFFERLSAPEYADIRRQSETLQNVVAFDLGNRQLTGGDVPQNLFTAFWWDDVLPTLGLEPTIGRGFTRQEIREAEAVLMISHRVWQARFAGDASVVGSTVRVDGDPYTLVGVFPSGADIFGSDLWLPMWVDPEVLPRDRRQFQVIGRIRDGYSLADVNAELETIARRTEEAWGAEFDEYGGWRLAAATWADVHARNLRPAAMILLGAVAFVLLLVCANVASLLLSRSTGRRREIAVRSALGAGRGRIARQLLTESVVLALVGGVVGVLAAWGGLRLLASWMPVGLLPTQATVDMNLRVLGYSAGLSLLAGVLFGMAPAFQALRADLQQTLASDSGRATGGASRRRWQGAFVVVEVALALVLLVGAGLLVHSFVKIQSVDPGFDSSDLLTMRLTLPWNQYQGDAIFGFFDELTRRVEEIPGVRSAAAASQLPAGLFIQRQFTLPGRQAESGERLPTAWVTMADDGYLETLGIPLLRGRSFDEDDVAGQPMVAVVNEVLARRYFGDSDPVGQRIEVGAADEPGPRVEIVGVAGAVRNLGVQQEPAPEAFVSLRQTSGQFNQLFLVIRTDVEPHAVVDPVREAVWTMDPDQPVYAIRTMEEKLGAGVAPQRFAMQALLAFAAVALLLAAVGIYGVVSHAVSDRTREIGVRMALGAAAGTVSRLMVRQTLLPVAIGVALGLALALALGQGISSLLYEVGGTDPATLVTVAALLVGIATLASWIPARRASRIDPVEALRAS